MKKNKSMAGIVLVILLLILSGCGELGGAPGSDSQDTGILIQSASIVGDDEGSGDHEIDVAIHLCAPDFTEWEDGLFEAMATMTINAHATGYDPFPASIEECTIEYRSDNRSPDSPIIEGLTQYLNCTLKEGKNECLMTLMDVDRKVKWWDDANAINFNHTYPTPYTVKYECTYVNQYGNAGKFQTEYDIRLADWDNC